MFQEELKTAIRSIARKLGYEIRRRAIYADHISVHEAAIYGIATSKKLHVVVVGANDGKTNDPSYKAICGALSFNSSVTLIEPQQDLLPFLRQHYSKHSDATVVNTAIGESGTIGLYSIRKDIWPFVQPDYAKSWPVYRAPSGIVSSNRQHVVDWGKRSIRGRRWRDEFVTESCVPCVNLLTALTTNSRPRSVDVLQIDTEGMDDIVLQHCNLEITKPKIIRFEVINLTAERKHETVIFLKSLGYHVELDGQDAIAFLLQHTNV